MKRVLIIEDKKESREMLVKIVKEVEGNASVYAVSDEKEAYNIAMQKNIDLFLVDIILHPERTGDSSGASFAQNIRTVEKYLFTPIIFVTSLYDTKACMYSTVQCYSFIEKPFDVKKVKHTIQRALRFHKYEDDERKFIFHTEGLLEAVLIKDIVYIETRNHKVHVATAKEKFQISYKTGPEIMEELASENFVKCNRNYIVNLNQIEKIDPVNRYISLKGVDISLEIGPVMKKEFLRRFYERYQEITK